MAANLSNSRFSVASLGSLISSSTDGTGVDASFMSLASTSSSGSLGYEIESEVGREALKEICCSALSRALDFPDCQLEVLLGYDEENNTGDAGGGNVAKNITASLRTMKKGLSALYHHHAQAYQIATDDPDGASSSLSFGSPICESNQVILLQLITHMVTFLSAEGLFRKSGNKGRMDLLVKGLEGGQFGRVTASGAYNAHDFASVLKQYFSELPEPLLLKRQLNAYLQVAALASPATSLRCLQLLMLLLPPVHRVILQHLLDLLFQVTRSPDNKMDSHNLSLIFAPTLFLAVRSESLSADDFGKLSQLLAYMIDNCEDIFEVPPEVQVVAERYCRKRSKKHHTKKLSGVGEEERDGEGEGEEESLPIDLYTTSCKRACVETFHESGKERAMDEVAKLYEMVKNMPDGPQKNHFMKRFDLASKTGCTPTSVPKRKHLTPFNRLKRSLMKNKENATPKITAKQIQLKQPCFKKGSLAAEFDAVESSTKDTPAPDIQVLDHTPYKGKENCKTPAEFATPHNFNAPTPCDLFKTPHVPSERATATRVPVDFKTPGVLDFKTPGGLQTPNFKTPGEFKTPTASSEFKTPGTGALKSRMIPTNSTLVTDV